MTFLEVISTGNTTVNFILKFYFIFYFFLKKKEWPVWVTRLKEDNLWRPSGFRDKRQKNLLPFISNTRGFLNVILECYFRTDEKLSEEFFADSKMAR